MISFLSSQWRRTLLLNAYLFVAVFALPLGVDAIEIVPFATHNKSPLVQIYGIPSAASAVSIPKGRSEFSVRLDLAANFIDEKKVSEQLTLDGETMRLTLTSRYGISKNLEIGIEIPTIFHGGGFLDGFLINFHELFGFSQGGRDSAPRYRFLYYYRRGTEDRLKIDSSGGGLGDIALNAGLQLYHEATPYPLSAALQMGIKLPTGDSGFLYGSGSTDFFLRIAAENHFALPIGEAAIYGALGCLVMTKGNVLPNQQVNLVKFGMVGVGWKPLSWIGFKLQADLHTSFYRDSDFKALSANSIQLQIGGTIGLAEKTYLDIAVSEDSALATAPDVTFHLNLIKRF